MGEIGDVPSEVLEAVAYLARSENRVVVLESLSEGPHSTRALRDRTEISKSTLSRILNEFEERSWARRTGSGEYVATARAEHLVGQFEPFLASMQAIRDVGDDLGVVPVDELTVGSTRAVSVGLHHFADATVKHQRQVAQGVGRAELKDAYRDASVIRVLTDMAPSTDVGEVLQARADEGDLSGVHVWSTDLYEHLLERAESPPRWADLIEAGTSLYHFDGDVPANVCVVDDTTFIWGATGEMRHRVLISRNATVNGWASALVDRYRERSEEIRRAAFAER